MHLVTTDLARCYAVQTIKKYDVNLVANTCAARTAAKIGSSLEPASCG